MSEQRYLTCAFTFGGKQKVFDERLEVLKRNHWVAWELGRYLVLQRLVHPSDATEQLISEALGFASYSLIGPKTMRKSYQTTPGSLSFPVQVNGAPEINFATYTVKASVSVANPTRRVEFSDPQVKLEISKNDVRYWKRPHSGGKAGVIRTQIEKFRQAPIN